MISTSHFGGRPRSENSVPYTYQLHPASCGFEGGRGAAHHPACTLHSLGNVLEAFYP
jgi:hypothetical protein